MNDFRYVGSTPTDLEGGRPIAPGEFTGEIDVTEEAPKNKMLLDEGLLVPAPSEAERETLAQKAEKAQTQEESSAAAAKDAGDTEPTTTTEDGAGTGGTES